MRISTRRFRFWISVLIISIAMTSSAATTAFAQFIPSLGYLKSMPVTRATDLDWVFAFANQSLDKVPERVLSNYESTKQRFELYVPRKWNLRQKWPLVLFISPGQNPAGYKQWKTALEKNGVIFASPFGAGNGVPTPKRIRIVMDVLAEVRRIYNVDPDRTYIAGFSGGGRIAAAIAFALPEYFGGVIPICAGGELRQEPALRQRVKDRLSIAHLTGANDFNRGEVERMHHTMFSTLGYREKAWVVPRLGHGIPNASAFGQALEWLEDDLPRRRALAKQHPISSISSPITREVWAKALNAEAKQRLKNKATLYSGLMQLHMIQTRWNDLPQAREAKQILTEYDGGKDRSWAEQDVAEQRAFLIAKARGVDAYASGDLPKQYQAQRESMLKAAINLWKNVVQDGVDEEAVKEARLRIPKLEVLLETQ